MKLPTWVRSVRWGRSVRRQDGVGSVTVVLDVDVSEYVKALDEALEAGRRWLWELRIADERRQARQWLDDLLDDMWARYGWERPLLPSRVGVGRTRWTLVKPADHAAPTVAEVSAGIDLTCFIEGDPA